MNRPDSNDPAFWQPTKAAATLDHLNAAYVDGSGEAAFEEILAALRAKALWLLLWILICVGLAGVYLQRTAPEYVATAQIVLEPRSPSISGREGVAGTTYLPTLDSAQADSQVQVLKSERTLRFVFDTLDLVHDSSFASPAPSLLARFIERFRSNVDVRLPESEQQSRAREIAFNSFASRVGVRRVGLSYAIDLSYQAPSPEQAAKLANSIAMSYILQQIKFRAASALGDVQYLQGRIADIRSQQDAALAAVHTGIIPDKAFGDADALIVSSAVPPLGKSYPKSSLIILLAILLSLGTGAATIALRYRFSRIVRSRQRLARILGINTINSVPYYLGNSKLKLSRPKLDFRTAINEPQADFVEALRILRTVILSANRTPHHLALGVVSCSSQEGRSTVASNLAFLIGASRERVCLIDADFRNPTLTRALAPDAQVGLDQLLLTHEAEVAQIGLQFSASLEFVPAVAAGQIGSQDVFIGSAEMARFLQARRAIRDVVIDLPPMSLSSDAQAIGHLLDGVILVVESGRTRLDEVRETYRVLQMAHTRVLSVVLNKAPAAQRRGKL